MRHHSEEQRRAHDLAENRAALESYASENGITDLRTLGDMMAALDMEADQQQAKDDELLARWGAEQEPYSFHESQTRWEVTHGID